MDYPSPTVHQIVGKRYKLRRATNYGELSDGVALLGRCQLCSRAVSKLRLIICPAALGNMDDPARNQGEHPQPQRLQTSRKCLCER